MIRKLVFLYITLLSDKKNPFSYYEIYGEIIYVIFMKIKPSLNKKKDGSVNK